VVEESFDGITVVGLSFNRTMMALDVSLDRAIAACVTFDRMMLTLSILACVRLDAAELQLVGVLGD